MSENATTANRFVFPEALTVQHIENVHAELVIWLNGLATHSAHLDMTAVNRVDSSGYQVLLSLCKSLDARDVTYQVQGASNDFAALLRQFGDTKLLAMLDTDHA